MKTILRYVPPIYIMLSLTWPPHNQSGWMRAPWNLKMRKVQFCFFSPLRGSTWTCSCPNHVGGEGRSQQKSPLLMQSLGRWRCFGHEPEHYSSTLGWKSCRKQPSCGSTEEWPEAGAHVRKQRNRFVFRWKLNQLEPALLHELFGLKNWQQPSLRVHLGMASPVTGVVGRRSWHSKSNQERAPAELSKTV